MTDETDVAHREKYVCYGVGKVAKHEKTKMMERVVGAMTDGKNTESCMYRRSDHDDWSAHQRKVTTERGNMHSN